MPQIMITDLNARDNWIIKERHGNTIQRNEAVCSTAVSDWQQRKHEHKLPALCEGMSQLNSQ